MQKLIAAAGFGSRREVEQFLEDERVTVNGRVAKVGDKADPGVDEIRVDGERLTREKPSYWIVNKPRGVVTTVRDDEGRKTIVNLVPRNAGRLFPVGRLDRETSGLVLMTNDGDVAFTLLHPSLGNEREYRVNVKGLVDSKAIGRLERGVNLEEGRTSPARVSDVRFDSDSATSSLTLTLSEGKKRQIRRSLLVLGFPVRRLVRVRMGPLRIGRLPVGESRPLRSEEKRALLEHVRRLRAGEKPLASSTRSDSGKRTASARNVSANPPRPTTARRGRGSAGGPKSTSPARKTRKASSARPSPSGPSKAKAKGRKSAARKTSGQGAARGRTRGPKSSPKKSAAKSRTASPVKKAGGRATRAKPARPSSGSKPAARKPSGARKPGGQRTPSSRKGTRR